MKSITETVISAMLLYRTVTTNCSVTCNRTLLQLYGNLKRTVTANYKNMRHS